MSIQSIANFGNISNGQEYSKNKYQFDSSSIKNEIISDFGTPI